MIYLSKLIKETHGDNGSMIMFLDMDGVLTDYYGALDAVTPEGDEFSAMDVAAEIGPKWWIEMEWLPDGRRLWDYVKQHYKNIHILSAVDGPGTFGESAIQGKTIWLKRHIPEIPESHFHFVYDGAYGKAKFADQNRILVDDRVENIDAWIENGGIGIVHQNARYTIRELENL